MRRVHVARTRKPRFIQSQRYTDSRVKRSCTLKLFTWNACPKLFHCISNFPRQYEIMHTQHDSTEHRLSRNKILIINSNDNTQSGHSENGLTFKCDYLESLCLRCKDVCDGTKCSRRYVPNKILWNIRCIYTCDSHKEIKLIQWNLVITRSLGPW